MVDLRMMVMVIYHYDYYCIYFTFDVDFDQHSACSCMF
jgi:hypothetical protein